ncbi:Synaptic vesicle 2-related protein [Seminavis robusta]|uniref:Synaptic vesicle 2-related protein n=1 Tax=Seminavis robusta TaxID=568900 RepID=A0A9N8DAV5_9STRA|nr:Synaptic vesicle 2-related protein [Seminavis robusta]|eukprot:Sro18_g013070.1 Synaptic vesicle 2-related protein (514) ;mRNA; f:139805-141597
MPSSHGSSGGKKKSSSSGSPVKLTIDDALARLEYGPFHTRLLIMGGIATMANCMAVMASFFFPQDFDGGNLSDFQAASLTAILFLGTFMGVFFVNFASDSFGRRSTFLVCAATTSLFGFVGGLMPNYAGIMIMRFLVGFGLGGTNAPFYYLAEFVPHQQRGVTLLKLGYAWALGSIVTPFLGLATLDKDGLGPPVFLFLCSIPSVISLVAGFMILPESPRWLMSKGQNEVALSILRDAAIINHQDPWAICPQSAHLMRGGKTKSKWKAITRLFRKEWRRMIMCLLPTFLVVDFLYYSYVQLIHMTISNTDGAEDDFEFVWIGVSAIAELAGIAIAIFAIDRVGRVPTQAVSYLVAGILIMGIGIGRNVEDNTTDDRIATSYLFYLCFVARMFITLATNVTWVHTVEILPKKIRATFHITAHALASLGGAASAYHMVTPGMKFSVVAIVVGVITLLTSLLTWTFPETKTLALGNSVSRSISRDGVFTNRDNEEEKSMLSRSSDDSTIDPSLGSL